MGLPGSEDSLNDRLSRFDTIPSCDGQTDRRPAYINNVRSMTDRWRTLKTQSKKVKNITRNWMCQQMIDVQTAALIVPMGWDGSGETTRNHID